MSCEELALPMHGEELGQVSDGQEEKIFVAVRLRPLNDKEVSRNDVSDWECINKDTIVFKHNLPDRSMFPTAYTFDSVFGCDCPTDEVYLEAAKEIALSVLSGINSTIFAYGQTSSGKTYTMSGITELAVADIYDYIEKHEEREFSLKFSAMEIYNEAVRDLLSSDTTPLRLLDDPERGTVVERLTEETLQDWDHLQDLLSICEAQRQIGETSLNETSSRSHQILRLTIESSAREYSGAGNSSTLAASVNFVDLAGSERASQTLSAGARLKEGCHINRSLLTLGTVIRKLSKARNGHVPYRDSKLTRILQNSLGGNARTAIICTMSPARSHVEQSRNTLLFANCAKEVATNAQVNLVMSDKALVKQLQRELAKLESELKSLGSTSAQGDSAALLSEKELLIEQMTKEIKELTQQRDLAQSRVENLLQSVGKSQTLKQDEYSALKSIQLANPPNLDALKGLTEFHKPSVPTYNNQFLETSENPEDNFLLDDSTPKFVGPDPCQGWEEIAQRTDEEAEVNCKEVRCIEIEKSSIKTDVKTDISSLSPENKEGELPMTEAIIKKTEADEISIYPEDKEEKIAIKPMIEDSASKADVSLNPKNKEEELATERKTEASEFSIYQDEKDENVASIMRLVEDIASSPRKGAHQLSHSNTGETYDALKLKVQELQRTIFALSSLREQSPCSSDASGCSGLSLTRSRSCRAVLTSMPSSLCFEKVEWTERTLEKNRPGRPVVHYRKFSDFKYAPSNRNISRRDSQSSLCSSCIEGQSMKDSDEEDITNENMLPPGCGREARLHQKLSGLTYGTINENIFRKDSQSSLSSASIDVQSLKDSDVEDISSIHDSAPGLYEVPKAQQEKQIRDDLVQETAENTVESEETTKDATDLHSSWPLEFERQQTKIIELWDACHVPLIHRTYFFLLFKGDPSDSVYLEVELRRLSFLKNSLSCGPNSMRDSQFATAASSMKDLIRERAMLSKQIQKRFSRKDREKLYQKWGIGLKTKQRTQKLAHRLWTDTKDVDHIKESAALVARLIGFVEPERAPKEVFGLSFLPRTVTRGRSYRWK